MTNGAKNNFSHLPESAGRLGTTFARPRLVAIACVVTLSALGWAYLALLIANVGSEIGVLGPGMGTLNLLSRAIAALCRPTLGMGMLEGTWGASGFALVALMWVAMVLAMMLPSAAPMILTYAQIAETAARKGEHIASPLAIAAGYSVVWLGFALIVTFAQFGLTRADLLDAGAASASVLFSGAIFIGAGLYQFSALKHACLTQCRQPFSVFFAHWEPNPGGVFRLGLKQGFYCLGCCWAMMLVMFAVGVMNVIWMAALGIIMTLEKIGSGNRLSYGLGAVLIALGVALVLLSFAAHWPTNAI